MLSIVPVRISAVKTFGPDTILNLLNHSFGVTCTTYAISTIILAKVAGQDWPTTLTLPQVLLFRPHLAPQDSQGRFGIHHTHQYHTSQAD
jgi:hypothetical protein